MKSAVLPAAAGGNTEPGYLRYPFGANVATTWDWEGIRGGHSGGGAANGQTAGGVWAAVVSGGGNAGQGYYLPQWCPAIDPLTCPPGEDDPNQRIAWFKLWVLEDAAQPRPAIADSLGFTILPDDGLTYGTTTWSPALVGAAGGFGICRRVGDDGHRWVSYAAAGALLEAVNLAGGAGWHSCDIIIRQAVFGDLSTPWLTLRWDGVDIIRERAFGHALLPTPQSLRANAHGWAFHYGKIPTDTGKMALRSRIRIGRFHPDGYVQP